MGDLLWRFLSDMTFWIVDNVGTVWFTIVISIILVRAAFLIAKRQLTSPIGLLMGGGFGAIRGTVVGGIMGALVSRTTINMMITLVNPELNVDIYQVTIYGGVSGAIIGTTGGAIVGTIAGSWSTATVFTWLGNIAISLAFLTMGIGVSIVLGKFGGLMMYGASSAAMQWYILSGRLNKYDIELRINMIVGFFIWTVTAMFFQSLGGMVVGAIGGSIVGVCQGLIVEKEWLVIERKIKVSIQEWTLVCAVLGSILGGIIELFTEYIIW